MKKTIALAAAAALLSVAPAAAIANPAQSLSVAAQRASAPTGTESRLAAETSPIVSVLLGAAALVGILAIAGALGDDDQPVSA